MRDRNHEGYHDPTACRAIRNADRAEKRKSVIKSANVRLTYRIGEIQAFKNVVSGLRR